jgi:hypothetical protein
MSTSLTETAAAAHGFNVFESRQRCLESEDRLVEQLKDDGSEKWVDPLLADRAALDKLMYVFTSGLPASDRSPMQLVFALDIPTLI